MNGEDAACENTLSHISILSTADTNTPAHITNDGSVKTDMQPGMTSNDSIETNAPQHTTNDSISETNFVGGTASELSTLRDSTYSQTASSETQGGSQIKTGDTRACNSDVSSTDASGQKSNCSSENRTRTAQPHLSADGTRSGEKSCPGDDGAESSSDQNSPWHESRARFQHLVLGKYGQKELSLLHVAASAGHATVITALLEAGCDPTLRLASCAFCFALFSSPYLHPFFYF